MATETLPSMEEEQDPKQKPNQPGAALPAELRRLLAPLASLKFTVVLFAMAIFIVLAGTFAQWDKDINEVIGLYFRVKIPTAGSFQDYFSAMFVRIPFKIFFPPSFFPNPPQVSGGLYFPKGWLIGSLMAVNLLAAHAVRFKVQAKGTRLYAGVGVLGLGILATWLVVGSGSSQSGLQTEPIIAWETLWEVFSVIAKIGLPAGAVGLGVYASNIWHKRPLLRYVLIGIAALLLVVEIWFLSKGEAATLNGSSMRILWLLLKATLSSLILLAGCVLAFRKRAGIVLLHAGIGLMMFNELLVGTTHQEAQMIISEGETTNYVQDIDTTEIAIIDRSDDEEDAVVVVPLSRLNFEETTDDSQLPIQVDLIELVENARLIDANTKLVDLPAERTSLYSKFFTCLYYTLEFFDLNKLDNPATAGEGLNYIALPKPTGKGTDIGGTVDLPAIYVKLTGKDGKDLGIRLLALELSLGKIEEDLKVGDKSYDVSLRFERHYKPYSVHLIDLHKDDYVGTTTVKNYESDIRLVDESRSVDRELSIWMNNPLRFAGETFYQSNYNFDPRTGVETTTLQVVENNGWMIPYVSCMIVVVGLFAQFGSTLFRFLKRREKEAFVAAARATHPANSIKGAKGVTSRANRKNKGQDAAELEPGGLSPQEMISKYAPFVVAAIVGLWLISSLVPKRPQPEEMNLQAFGQLPLAYEGRIKPFDTLARVSLRQISGKQTTKDKDGKRIPAIKWLLELVTNTREALGYKVFRIDNPDVLQTLGLERREGYLYSYEEFAPNFNEFLKQTRKAHEKAAINRDSLSVYERKLIETEKRIGIVDLLLESLRQPEMTQEDLVRTAQRAPALMNREPPLVIPPITDEDKKENRWQALPLAALMGIMQEQMSKQPMPATTKGLMAVFDAYGSRKPGTFNAAVADYRAALEDDSFAGPELDHTEYESHFNHAEPFYKAMLVYGFAFLISIIAWLGWSKPLNRTAFWIMVVTLLYHTWALYARIEISGRPPVTNLYSSAIFIGWGCVVLGLIMESVYRMGIGNLVAAATGFSSLLIAHLLSTSIPDHMGDNFNVMQAVLDTQFWLATHVVCVTLGYATTFIAGFLGIVYIVLGVFTPVYREDKDLPKMIGRMTYGTICFALVFSFFGTVLGGLWADDSWGRFWGWDPKENGALIIVLWNALVLHARWDGWIKERGFAVLAVVGNIVTAWSWFGVNELGVGMHSYGFTEGVLKVLVWFGLSQFLIMAIGMIPKERWMGAPLPPLRGPSAKPAVSGEGGEDSSE